VTITLDDPTTSSATEVRRDRWGRYLVVPPGGGKPTGYQRMTTLAKMLEDTSNLTTWSARMALLGAAKRPDIVASVLAADPNDRDTLNRLVEQAKEHGGANVRRELGTALHRFIELKVPDPAYQVPEPYTADVAAALDRIDAAGFDICPEYSEVVLVLDAYGVAGMCDMVVRRRSDGALFILDVKTGSSVRYGAFGWSVQLTGYSLANNIYRQGAAADGSDDERLPMPPVSRERGLILHVEPESGHADLYELELSVERFELAVAVRDARKVKDLLAPFVAGGEGTAMPAAGHPTSTVEPRSKAPVDQADGDATLPASPSASPRHDWVLDRIEAIKANADALALMARVWPKDVPQPKYLEGRPYTDTEVDTIAEVLVEIEATYEIPFGPEDPKKTAERAAATAAAVKAEAERLTKPQPEPQPEQEEDGRVAREASVLALLDAVTALRDAGGDDQRRIAQVQHWQGQATRKNVPWKLTDHPTDAVPTGTYRRALAAVTCADLVDLDTPDPDHRVRDLLALVLDDDGPKQPATPVGVWIGLLTIAQAERLADMAATAATNPNPKQKRATA